MQVLEDDDQRVAPGGGFDRGSPRGEQQVLVHALGAGLADGRGQQPRIAVRVLHADPLEPDPDRVAHLARRRVVVRAGQREEDLAHGPVGQLLAVGQTLRGGDDGLWREAWQPVEELFDQAGLPHPGRRDDADHRRPLLGHRTPRDELELGVVVFAADERQAFAPRTLALARPDHQPRCDRGGFSSCCDLHLVAELEVVGGPHGAVAGEDRPRLRGLLQARRDVGRVAGDEEVARGLVAAGHHLSGADPEPDGDAAVEQWIGLDSLAHGQGRGHRAVGVVAVGGGQAEHRHHRVADELLHRAAVLLDRLARDRVVTGKQAAHLLRVELLAERGRARHVGEEDGDDAALFGGDRHRFG